MNKLEKVKKKLGEETVNELFLLAGSDLEKRVVLAEQAMKQAQDELDANPKYQELKENLKALQSGKREVNSRQNAIISYCLHLLSE